MSRIYCYQTPGAELCHLIYSSPKEKGEFGELLNYSEVRQGEGVLVIRPPQKLEGKKMIPASILL